MSIWFKQTKVYQFTSSVSLNGEVMEQLLAQYPLSPCPAMSTQSLGWVSPFGADSEVMVHATGKYILCAYGREHRLLPASIINKELKKKIRDIRQSQQREVYAKEKASLREQIQATLLPNAFCDSSDIKLFFDLENNWLFIGSTNTSRCDEIIKALSEQIDGLTVNPLQPVEQPGKLMTRWLIDNQWPTGFMIERDCDMLDPDNEKSQVRFVQQNLAAKEVIAHLNKGAKVKKLTLSWQDRLHFTLDDHFLLTRIKFLDILEQQRQDQITPDVFAVLDADFTIMALSFSDWIKALIISSHRLVFVEPINNQLFLDQKTTLCQSYHKMHLVIR